MGQWRNQNLEVAQGAQGQAPGGAFGGPPKVHSILGIFRCQTMHNFVYLAKLHEPLVKHENYLGCSACLSAELSVVIDRANNYSRGVRFSDSAATASTSVSLTIIGPTS